MVLGMKVDLVCSCEQGHASISEEFSQGILGTYRRKKE